MKKTWDQRYGTKIISDIVYDGWLDEIQYLFSPGMKLLEIGVGTGPNLIQFGKIEPENIYACDFSKNAVEIATSTHPNIKLFLHDIRKSYDFVDGFFNIIVSDLSLHYFNSETTADIISELMRLLVSGGHLILRVNRAGDDHFGYNTGEMIEPDFFQVGEITKRFFRLETTEAFFSDWNRIDLKETTTSKYGSEKKTLVGLFQKKFS